MPAQNESRTAGLERLLQGQAPNQSDLLDEITVGLDSLTGFLNEQYLRSYIPAGGSKIKCVTGRPGCGKTHFAQVMLNEAEAASAPYTDQKFIADRRPAFIGITSLTFQCHADEYNQEIHDLLR